MKQTLQSIKVDVVDQEVAAINTQTSEQASDCELEAASLFEPNEPLSSDTMPAFERKTPILAQTAKKVNLKEKGERTHKAIPARPQLDEPLETQNLLSVNLEVGLDSNRSVEASPILKFMSNSFIKMKKPQNRLSNNPAQKDALPHDSQPDNLICADKSTPLIIQFRSQGGTTGPQAWASAAGASQNAFLTKQLPKDLTDTSQPFHDSTLPPGSPATKSIDEYLNNASFSTAKLFSVGQSFQHSIPHQNAPEPNVQRQQQAQFTRQVPQTLMQQQQRTLSEILLMGSRTPALKDKLKKAAGNAAFLAQSNSNSQRQSTSAQHQKVDNFGQGSDKQTATDANIKTFTTEEQSGFIYIKETPSEAQYVTAVPQQARMNPLASYNQQHQPLISGITLVKRPSRKKVKKSRRATLQKSQVKLKSSGAGLQEVSSQIVMMPPGAVQDTTPRPGVSRRSQGIANRGMSTEKLMRSNQSCLAFSTTTQQQQRLSKLNTAKPSAGRKSVPFFRAIELSTKQPLTQTQAPQQSRKDKHALEQSNTTNDLIVVTKLDKHLKKMKRIGRLIRPQSEAKTISPRVSPYKKTKPGGANLEKRTPYRRTEIFETGESMSSKAPEDGNALTTMYQMPSTQKLVKVNLLTQSQARIRSFTEQSATGTSRASIVQSASKQPQKRLKKLNAKDRDSPAIKLVQTIKPLGLRDCLVSPASKTGAFRLSLGAVVKGKKTGRSHYFKSVTSEVQIDLSGSVVAGEPAVSQSPTPADLKGLNVTKIICFAEIIQHLSFRELSSLLQLCKKTRYSKTVLKYQKQTYLTLLSKGQIELEKVDSSRSRMWFQRLNIQISEQQKMRQCLKVNRISITKKQKQQSPVLLTAEENSDLDTIRADLRRSEFSMPLLNSCGHTLQLKNQEATVQDVIEDVLKRLAAELPSGYYQGMNYLVISLYRVTASQEMTYQLALKLLSNEQLTAAFLDKTAEAITNLCEQLRVFILAYLPRLGQAMDRTGVETDFFAHTWFLTLLFHFQVNECLQRRQLKVASIANQRVIESLILDFICLDDAKSFVKVPLCALQQLELHPHALDQMTMLSPKITPNSSSYRLARGAYQSTLHQLRGIRKLGFKRQNSTQSQHSSAGCETPGGTSEPTDGEELDESEKLVNMIKKSAAEYMAGYSQLRSSKFKQEQSATRSVFSFFQSQPTIEQLEQKFIVRDFVESYRSFKVSTKVYEKLKSKQYEAGLSDSEISRPAEAQKNGPISILKSDYLTNIRQGAINTISLGCHLFGFGNDDEGKIEPKKPLDQHHLSFDDDDQKQEIVVLNPSKSLTLLQHSTNRQLHGQQTQKALFTYNATTITRPGTVIKKVRSAQTKNDFTQESLLSRAPIQKLVGKQLQVTGDAESINEHASIQTKSIAEVGGSTLIVQDSSDPPAKPDKNSSLLHKRAVVEVADFDLLEKESISIKNAPRQSQILSSSQLPDVEDINEADEQTLIANKIRISHIKGSHASFLTPSQQLSMTNAKAPVFLSPDHSKKLRRHQKVPENDVGSYQPKNIPKLSKVTISHPQSKALFQKTSSKELLSLFHAANRINEANGHSNRLSIEVIAKDVAQQDSPPAQISFSNHKMTKSNPLEIESALSMHQRLKTEECEPNEISEVSIGPDATSPAAFNHDSSLNEPSADQAQSFTGLPRQNNQNSDQTLSINSPDLAMLQSKSIPNIRGLAQILGKQKGGQSNRGTQRMFKKKIVAQQAAENPQSNRVRQRHNKIGSGIGVKTIGQDMRTPSTGTYEPDPRMQVYNFEELSNRQRKSANLLQNTQNSQGSIHANLSSNKDDSNSMRTHQKGGNGSGSKIDPEQQAQIASAARNAVFSMLSQQICQQSNSSKSLKNSEQLNNFFMTQSSGFSVGNHSTARQLKFTPGSSVKPGAMMMSGLTKSLNVQTANSSKQKNKI